MSYIDDLEQAAAEALAASSSATDSAQIMADVANGDENTTVTTANGEVKTLAKAIKDIIDTIEAGVEAPQVEPQTLSAGQTTITLSTMTTEGIAVYVEGSREFDFTVVNSTDFEFGESFPDGTRIWIVKRDIEGVADSFTVNTSTGSQTLSDALDQRVIYVDTIADLQALDTSGLVDGQGLKITTTGRAGDFVVKVGDFSTEVTNDPQAGVWVKFDDADATDIVAKRLDSKVINVKWFGTVGDDVADDTIAIQAASDFASLDPDKLLVGEPPSVAYRTSSKISIPVNFLGNDFRINHTGTDVAVEVASSIFPDGWHRRVQGIYVDHLGNDDADGAFLTFNGTVTLYQCFARQRQPNKSDYYAYKVLVDDSTGGSYFTVFDECAQRYDNGGSGDYCPIGLWIHGSANATTVHNCYFNANTNIRIGPVSPEPSDSSLAGVANGVLIDGGWFNGPTDGIGVEILPNNKTGATTFMPAGLRIKGVRAEFIQYFIDHSAVNETSPLKEYIPVAENNFLVQGVAFDNNPNGNLVERVGNSRDNTVIYSRNDPTIFGSSQQNDKAEGIVRVSSPSGNSHIYQTFSNVNFDSSAPGYIGCGDTVASTTMGRRPGTNSGMFIAWRDNAVTITTGDYNEPWGNYNTRFDPDGSAFNLTGTWGTVSDRRLKENIEYLGDMDAKSQEDDIRALRFCKYNLIADDDQSIMLGLIAQDVQDISPGLVKELDDGYGESRLAIKQSVLQQKAVIALQSALNKIDELEDRIKYLEGNK